MMINVKGNNNGLPKGWQYVKLEDFLDYIQPTPYIVNSTEYSDNYKIPVLTAGKSFILGKTNEKEGIFNSLPVIIFDDFTTASKFVNFPFKVKSSAMKILKPKDNSVCIKYVYYFMQTVRISNDTHKRYWISIYSKILIPAPPLPTQLAIVSKIEELFSELDKGIEQLKTAQQQLKTYRQAVLKWAFEGKLTNEWRSKQPNLISGREMLNQIKNEKDKIVKRNKKKVKSFPEIDEDELKELFEIPKEWEWSRNEDYLFEVKDGTHDTPKYQKDGIPFITQKNIREDGLTFTDVQYISEQDHDKFYLRSNVSKGDILISMIGHNRGMTAIVDTDKVFSIKNVGLFKFLHHLQLNKFSFYYYQSRVGLNIVLRKSKGGAQPFIGLTELRNWPVVVCSFEEQIQIVQEIESRLSVADKLEESINSSLQQAEALRQSILKKAFEGRLI